MKFFKTSHPLMTIIMFLDVYVLLPIRNPKMNLIKGLRNVFLVALRTEGLQSLIWKLNKFFSSWDVSFHEHIFSFSAMKQSNEMINLHVLPLPVLNQAIVSNVQPTTENFHAELSFFRDLRLLSKIALLKYWLSLIYVNKKFIMVISFVNIILEISYVTYVNRIYYLYSNRICYPNYIR